MTGRDPGTAVLDNRSTPCATGLIRTRARMAELPPGDLLVVLSHDRFAPVELPLWAERHGHEVVRVEREWRFPRTLHRITLRRTAGRRVPAGSAVP